MQVLDDHIKFDLFFLTPAFKKGSLQVLVLHKNPWLYFSEGLFGTDLSFASHNCYP